MDVCEVKIPQINVNDATARVVAWHVKEHARIEKGQPLLTVETSKAEVEITAPEDGFVHLLVAAGMEAGVGTTVALVAPTIDALKEASAALPGPSPVRATERARRLALEHGIDLGSLGIRGIVTERHLRDLVPGEDAVAAGADPGEAAAPRAARARWRGRSPRRPAIT
jgi:pyruvate/2-oxoglutarate dehydrogenase complex dihydrolipoamide acyltransferase (E2) component